MVAVGLSIRPLFKYAKGELKILTDSFKIIPRNTGNNCRVLLQASEDNDVISVERSLEMDKKL